MLLNEKTEVEHKSCEICHSATQAFSPSWLYKCPSCKLVVSTLSPYEDQSQNSGYSAEDHSVAFDALRRDNAHICLDLLRSQGVASGSMLEVGCAQGTFLEIAVNRGFQCLGLEPNNGLFQIASKRGLKLVSGFFPDDLPQTDTFDCVVFNDVFEHIPDTRVVMQNCHSRLSDGGILMLNIPMSTGIFYQVGRIFHKMGWKTPVERLWQVGSMSPHLYYFNRSNLTDLGEQCGFKVVAYERLKTVTLNGLWKRLRVASNFGFLSSVFIWTATLVAMPVLNFLPADAAVLVFKKRART